MNIRIFAVCVVALVLLMSLFFYRYETIGLQTAFDLQLTVYPEGPQSYGVNGTGYLLDDNANFSILKWLDSGQNTIYSQFLYFPFPKNDTRINSVTFDLILYLNQTEKVMRGPVLKNPGVYNVAVRCSFDDVERGNYNLTTNLVVEGSSTILANSQFWIYVR